MNTGWQSDVVEFLKVRWRLDLINQIVITLNEGGAIDEMLEDLDQHSEAPPVPGRLDLRGIDLSHQNLRGPWQSIDGVRFRMGVNLEQADLRHANLRWTILPRANLRKALCSDTNFDSAELIRADMSETDLSHASFVATWFLDTHLEGAKVSEDQLTDRRKLGQLDFDYHAFRRL